MTRRSKAILVASHLLLVVAGGLFAWQSGAGFSRHPSSATKQSQAGPSAGLGLSGTALYPTNEWRGSEYARAWKALRNGKYTTKERIRLQRDLLGKWAEIDLAAAIEAALGEAWDRDGSSDFDPCGPLLDVFSEALANNPQDGWDMIRGRQFCVGTGMLRRVWMEAVGSRDPLFLAKRLGELSWRDRDQAVAICRTAIQNRSDGVTAAELFKVFAGFPDEWVSAEQLMEFVPPLDGSAEDAAELKQEISRLANEDSRLAKVKAMLLGKRLAGKTPDEIADEAADLPEGVRAEVVWAAFKDNDKPENTPGLVDLLIEENAWAKVEQRETVQQLQKLARNGGAAEVAEWAMTLPVRKETIELFHRSVEAHLAESLEHSRDWLAKIPPGVWRDRAHAEYSQVALHVYNNSRASRWALAQIGDDNFKREAEGWRSQWEKRTGWAGN